VTTPTNARTKDMATQTDVLELVTEQSSAKRDRARKPGAIRVQRALGHACK